MIYFTFKKGSDSVDLMSAGNAFQHLGAATANAYCRSDRLVEHHSRANTTRSIIRSYSNNIREIIRAGSIDDSMRYAK